MPVQINGATSGSTTLQATDAATATLTLPSSTGTLLSTANPQLGGVIQVVQGTYGTETAASTTTWIDTGLTATITPKFSTSKILVVVNQVGCGKDGSNTRLGLRLLRSSTTILNIEQSAGYNGNTGGNFIGGIGCNYLDSPATTSATTYKTQQNSFNNSSSSRTQQDGTGSNVVSTITLMEIAQ